MSINSPGSPQFGMYRGVPTPPPPTLTPFSRLIHNNPIPQSIRDQNNYRSLQLPVSLHPHSTDSFVRGLGTQQQSPIAPRPVASLRQQRYTPPTGSGASGSGLGRPYTQQQRLQHPSSRNSLSPSLPLLAEHPLRSNSPFLTELEANTRAKMQAKGFDEVELHYNGGRFMISRAAGEVLEAFRRRKDREVTLDDLGVGTLKEINELMNGFETLRGERNIRQVGSNHVIDKVLGHDYYEPIYI